MWNEAIVFPVTIGLRLGLVPAVNGATSIPENDVSSIVFVDDVLCVPRSLISPVPIPPDTNWNRLSLVFALLVSFIVVFEFVNRLLMQFQLFPTGLYVGPTQLASVLSENVPPEKKKSTDLEKFPNRLLL